MHCINRYNGTPLEALERPSHLERPLDNVNLNLNVSIRDERAHFLCKRGGLTRGVPL